MTNFLNPNLKILPEPQLKLWPELSVTPTDFILYRGTAIALRLGHRVSIDFDFFSPNDFDPEQLYRSISYLNNSKVIQKSENTLTCSIERQGNVLISFFGGLTIGQVGYPSIVESNKIQVASIQDLAGTKAAVIQKRVELKDYLDIDALLTAGLSLSTILACGQAIYAKAFNPFITLQALCYFEGVELQELSESVKQRLTQAVRNVEPGKLPQLTAHHLGDTGNYDVKTNS